jgi:membrane fusion protein, heavy metal efflux system
MNNKHVLLIQTSTLSLLLALSLMGCSGAEKNIDKTASEAEATPDMVQLSPQAIRRTGIVIETVSTREAGREIGTMGEIKTDENKIFHINSFVAGRVTKDNAYLGDFVRQGQVLALIRNLDVVKIQAESIHELHTNEVAVKQAKTRLTLAQQNLGREQQLLAEGISPRKDYLQASADATLARSELMGLEEHKIHIQSEAQALMGAYGMGFNGRSEHINTSSPLSAPRSGIIIKKNITVGDMVTPDETLYEVADLSQVWLDMTIYPKDLTYVREGQQITFVSDSLPGQSFLGRINYVQPMASEPSETFLARAYFSNPGGLLRPGMFGKVSIRQVSGQILPFIPEAAVQKYGKETFVFIPQGEGHFRKQIVLLGDQVPGGYLVQQGLQPGEKVVGKGSFTLKAEMLKSQFGED